MDVSQIAWTLSLIAHVEVSSKTTLHVELGGCTGTGLGRDEAGRGATRRDEATCGGKGGEGRAPVAKGGGGRMANVPPPTASPPRPRRVERAQSGTAAEVSATWGAATAAAVADVLMQDIIDSKHCEPVRERESDPSSLREAQTHRINSCSNPVTLALPIVAAEGGVETELTHFRPKDAARDFGKRDYQDARAAFNANVWKFLGKCKFTAYHLGCLLRPHFDTGLVPSYEFYINKSYPEFPTMIPWSMPNVGDFVEKPNGSIPRCSRIYHEPAMLALCLGDGDSDGGGKDGLAERRPVPKAPPVNTTTYTVSAHDTLTSVAARFDTTPSELAEINRLATRLVFPGQVLQVPLKDGTGTGASAVAAAAVTPCRGAWTPADPTAAAAAAPAA
ncbi:uncharacterized protein LOC113466943, partial [Gryllus bimaculatus]